MGVRKILAAVAALGLVGAPAASVMAAVPSAEEAPVQHLQATILGRLATTNDKQAALDAIIGATTGWPLNVIAEAICPLVNADLAGIYGQDPAAIGQAQATREREPVREALTETCETARLALASYGATGGIGTVPARGGVGRAFGLGVAAGSPGGGGGSGYVPPGP